MQLTDLEAKVLRVLVGLAGGRPEYVHLAEVVRALELPEEDVERELRTLNQAMLVWFQERAGYKHVQPDIKAVALVREWATPPVSRRKRVVAFVAENLKKGFAATIEKAVIVIIPLVLGLVIGKYGC